MKTLLITSFSGIILLNTLKANNAINNTSSEDPGQATKEQFANDFGNIKLIGWEKNKQINEATFIKDGQTISAFYDDSPSLIGTTEAKQFKDLPEKTQKQILLNYKGYTITDIILFDDNENNQATIELYNQSLEEKDSYFIELKKANKKIVLESDLQGNISLFTRLQ